MEEVGLAAPQVTYVMHDLKDRGFDVSPDATTIEEAADEIMRSCLLYTSKNIYALPSATILVQKEKEVQMAVNEFGKGRAVYILSLIHILQSTKSSKM